MTNKGSLIGRVGVGGEIKQNPRSSWSKCGRAADVEGAC